MEKAAIVLYHVSSILLSFGVIAHLKYGSLKSLPDFEFMFLLFLTAAVGIGGACGLLVMTVQMLKGGK